MKAHATFSFDSDQFLDVAAYVTIGAVYVLALTNLWRQSLDLMLSMSALFAVFVLVQIRCPHASDAIWRRRAFCVIEGLLATVILISVPGGGSFTPILFIVLVAQTFFLFDAREALLWTLIYTALIAMLLFVLESPLAALLTTLIYVGAFMFFAAVTISLRREQVARGKSERLLRELEAAHAQLREYAVRVEELAIAEERTRVAREIHDSLGHHLTILSVQLQAASKLMALDPKRAAGEIEKARAVVANALQDVRQSVSTLRATTVSELQPAEAIAYLIQEFREVTGIVVNYQADELPTPDGLSPAQSLTLFRAAQEGLTNVQKHAHASRVDVCLQYANQQIRLRVVDNGVGDQGADSAKADDSGFGLMGLRERVELLGGTLTSGRHDGAGFALCVELPVAAKADA